MFRVVQRVTSALHNGVRHNLLAPAAAGPCIRYSHGHKETPEEFDARYLKRFTSQDIDGWDLRQAINDFQGEDAVPEPKIIIAALKACRKVNDYGLAVRYLEAVKDKCGKKVAEIWPYLLKEIKPTLDELGILTPEEMGYDKPELAVKDVYDM